MGYKIKNLLLKPAKFVYSCLKAHKTHTKGRRRSSGVSFTVQTCVQEKPSFSKVQTSNASYLASNKSAERKLNNAYFWVNLRALLSPFMSCTVLNTRMGVISGWFRVISRTLFLKSASSTSEISREEFLK